MNASVMAEPYKISAGALALLVHAIFFSLLYFSFSWQMKPPQGMVVDIWDSLPADVEVPAQQQLEKQEPVIAPKVEPVAVAPSPAKAEIEIKNKKKLKAEKIKADDSPSRKLAEKRAEQAERRMEEVERQAQSRSQAQNKAQKEAAAASGKVVDEYIAKIAAKIKRSIVLPPGVAKNIKAEFNVTLLPSGEVLNASLAKSSGNEAYDSAVERAILKAQPLPLPPAEQNLFNRFRDLHLKFSPAESGQ
jgi:colicin import membrane protein